MTAKLELRAFIALNEGMALRYILDLLQNVEKHWGNAPVQNGAMDHLLEALSWARVHRSEKVQALASLPDRIPHDPSYHQFMTLVAPIERAYGRSVTDGEISARFQDREKSLDAPLPLVLVVDNLRSAFNIGSIFRIAECTGVSHLYLCGYTATPEQEKLKKTSMGTDTMVPWSWHSHAEVILQELKDRGYRRYALETSDRAQLLTTVKFPRVATALVFGNERYGIEFGLMELCESVIEIPCQGQKNSLNVAVAVGIATYEWRRQWTEGSF